MREDGEEPDPPDTGDGGTMEHSDLHDDNGATGSTVPAGRTRQYGVQARGPFVVYLRAKKKHNLAVMQISTKTFKKYESVESILPVNRDKLKISVKNREDANKLVKDGDFCRDFFTYIPSKSSEVYGKIFLNECEDIKDIMEAGYGVLDGSSDVIVLLDAIRLKKKVVSESNSQLKNTPFVRIIFEGTILPDFLVVNKLRIPVKPFAPRVMECKTCFRFGHTEAHCGSRPRCDKCGLFHTEGSSSFPCTEGTYNCPNCKLLLPQKNHVCTKLGEIKDLAVDRSLARRRAARPAQPARVEPPNVQSADTRNNQNPERNQGHGGARRKVNIRTNYDTEFPDTLNRNRFDALASRDDEATIDNFSDLSGEVDVMDEKVERSPLVKGIRAKRKHAECQEELEGRYFRWAKDHDERTQKNARTISPPEAQQAQQGPVIRRSDSEKSNVEGRSIGWKDVFLGFFATMECSEGMMSFAQGILLPWIEGLLVKHFPMFFL
uniref:Nucleic-acid-binding protein from mobile element jockey n=1 Tax=Lutzomyia longipalpis TaxID=7200 RepID=A0A7G3B598_LUTLO